MIPGASTDSLDFQTFKTVLSYCLTILTLPVFTFFVFKFVIFDVILELSPVSSSVYSAIAAVIALHIALGAYIYRAYSVATPPKASSKID